MHNHDIVATVGTYEKQDGSTGYVTETVGKILKTKNGYFKIKLKASFNPAGLKKSDDGGVWLSIFEPKEKDQTQAPKPSVNDVNNFNDNDIPF